MVRHLNKSGKSQSMYRGLGSIGIIASTRSGLLVGKDPKDQNMRVLCHVKSNLGPLAPSMLFEPVAKGGAVAVEWRGECDYGPDDLLADHKDHKAKLEDAKDYLIDVLSIGPMAQQDVQTTAAEMGISWRTMERAKDILGIKSRRKGFGPGSQVLWALKQVEV